MKKSILLAVLCCICVLGLAGCGGDNGIKLTKENYEKYLNISVTINCPNLELESGAFLASFSKECTFNLSTSGKSTNFNYNDVNVKVNIKGSFLPYEMKKCNSGLCMSQLDERKNIDITVQPDLVDVAGKSITRKTFDQYGYYASTHYDHKDRKDFDFDWEIVEISGEVVPIN